MQVDELLAERNWTIPDLVAVLGERGYLNKRGKPIGENAVKMIRGRSMDVPQQWLDAIEGVTAPTGSPPGADGGDGGAAAARSERPPSRPPGAPIGPLPVAAGSSKRIAGAYKMLGAALASGAGAPGVAVVFGDQADPIADLWIQAAQDSPMAARFVSAMNAGGTMGDLAAAHLYLAGACLYVLGAGIPGGDSLFPKYAQYRLAKPVPPAADATAPDAAQNGHDPDGSVGAPSGAVADG